MNTVLLVVAIIAIGYLIGSIPTANIMMHLFAKKDLRRVGTGNVTSTAVMIHAGKLPGTLSLIGEILKTFLCIAIAGVLVGDLWAYLLIYGGSFGGPDMERLAGVDRRPGANHLHHRFPGALPGAHGRGGLDLHWKPADHEAVLPEQHHIPPGSTVVPAAGLVLSTPFRLGSAITPGVMRSPARCSAASSSRDTRLIQTT